MLYSGIKNGDKMNKALFVVLMCLWVIPSYVFASASSTWSTAYNTLNKSLVSGRDTDSKSTSRPTYDAGDFIIKSSLAGLGNGSHEYDKIYAVIAEKKFENGACLRPVQISCWADAGWKDDTSHTRYSAATSVASKCQVFCADGYYGDTCSKKPDGNSKETSPATGQWQGASFTFGSHSGNTSFESSLQGAMYLYAYKHYNNQEADVVLGVTKFLPNGVKVAPVNVMCGSRRKKKDDHLFVKIKSEASGEVLLCSEGYIPNDANTDCVVPPESEKVPGVVVQNDDGSHTKITDTKTISLRDSLRAKPGFDEKIHEIVNTGKTLAIACKNKSHGFVSADSLTCVECVTGTSKKAGVSKPSDGVGYGVCVKCKTGEIFDDKANRCQEAKAISKNDMQYGQNSKTKAAAVVTQCWTKTDDAAVYKDCVLK